MQFLRNGPDIPERLLQAHEDGRVVFFCGAGISYPARLPGFEGLVDGINSKLGITPNPVLRAALKAKQFDTAIGLIEAEIVEGRSTVRRVVVEILTPDLSKPDAISTHQALLTMAKTREDRTRLVTTNFDRIFEEVIVRNSLAVSTYKAPLLPVPKTRWDGLVYLHGLISSSTSAYDLDQLILSSGDFGRAYLSERWAARFVSELFRNFTVCFVGYSITDPVLRYMMDALAADRLLGESPPEMFAFGSFSRGAEGLRASEWKAKNVTPILYREHNHHAHLHETLSKWSEVYRDGVRGKERIVVESALALPMASTAQDDFVGRLLWALSDARALPAKRFAELDPVPHLAWLEPLSEGRYGLGDLVRFGVSPGKGGDSKLAFSLVSRPSPYSFAPYMALVDVGARGCRWDDVMHHLAYWLVRHLDDPALLLWIVRRGGQMHEMFITIVEHRLDEIAKLEREGNAIELERIRRLSPAGIPRQEMRTLWRLLLTGRVKSSMRTHNLYRWTERFRRDGLTATLRLELRETLTPVVELRESTHVAWDESEGPSEAGLKDLVDWELDLSDDHAHHILEDVTKSERWREALPELLPEFTVLLRDVLDLMRELGGADDKHDSSYVHQPSISDHPQNRDFRDWTLLIKLVRDAWLSIAMTSPERALAHARLWAEVRYPLFRRLALFAAAQDGIVPANLALDWLLEENWWLWSVETEREALRLVASLAPELSGADASRLERAILSGPPRDMYVDSIEDARWQEIVDREIWERLKKIESAEGEIGPAGVAKLSYLSQRYPDWKPTVDQSDEFPFWMGDGDELRKFVASPPSLDELVNWLREPYDPDHWREDDWKQRCRDDFAITSKALRILANEGVWPLGRWREALQAWSDESLVRVAWRVMAKTLDAAPDDAFNSLSPSLSWWLQALAKKFVGRSREFFSISTRLIEAKHEDGMDDADPVTRAINHPVGHVTEALLRWWYRRDLQDGQGLPPELDVLLTRLGDLKVTAYRHARVILAANVIALFRVDPRWTTEHLLPLFSWSSEEARGVWLGFLWSPRLYRPLMLLLRNPFLEVGSHYESLGRHGRQFAAILTFAGLDPSDTFSPKDIAGAVRNLPINGLEQVAETLTRAQESAGDQREEYWDNRVEPFLEKMWPRSKTLVSAGIADDFARLCVASGDRFPRALGILKPWLMKLAHSDYIVTRLSETPHCLRFPQETLDFLSAIVDVTGWAPKSLRKCLSDIAIGASDLARDSRFLSLDAFLRGSGH